MTSARERAEFEARELRNLLAHHGIEPHPSAGPPAPRVLEPDLENIYELLPRPAARAPRSWDRFDRRPLARRPWAIAGAMATAATAIVTALALIAGSLVQAPQPANAATPPMLDYEHSLTNKPGEPLGLPAANRLRELADIAAHQPAMAPADASSAHHVTSLGWYSATDLGTDGSVTKQVVNPIRYDSWLAPDGTILIEEQQTGSQLDMNGQLLPGASPPKHEPARRRTAPDPQSWPPDLPARLSREPVELRRQLLQWGGITQDAVVPTPAIVVNNLWELCSTYVIPPDLQSAIWRMLASEGTIRTLGSVTDRSGVSGEAFAQWADRARNRLVIFIINPSTGMLGAFEEITFDRRDVVSDDVTLPAVLGFTEFVGRDLRPLPAYAESVPFE